MSYHFIVKIFYFLTEFQVSFNSVDNLLIPMQNYSRSPVAQCGPHGERLKIINALSAENKPNSALVKYLYVQ